MEKLLKLKDGIHVRDIVQTANDRLNHTVQILVEGGKNKLMSKLPEGGEAPRIGPYDLHKIQKEDPSW